MILQLEHITKSFGSRTLFSDVTFKLEEHDRLALVGPNGAGKTTLLNIITGHEDADSGRVLFAKGAKVGYLEQEAIEMGENPIFEEVLSAQYEIMRQEKKVRSLELALGDNPTEQQLSAYGRARDVYESMGGYELESRVRAVLFGLGFGEDDMERLTTDFSGGWQMRIALAKLLTRNPEVLLLDEPTNHLDLESVRWLEGFLRSYSGSVIVVSHDRDFLDGLATKVYEFGGGLVKEHLGGIYDFLQKKQIESLNDLQKSPSLSSSPSAEKTVAGGNAGATVAQPSAAKLSYEEQKELNKRLKKLERRVADCEAEIEQTEAAISILEAKMATPEGASDMALYEQHQKLKAQLDSVMEEWDAVSCELEEARK